MQSLGIVLLCILAAVVYGIVHDQVTARVCVEYFTIGHPPVFRTDDSTLLGIGWGIIATWWIGLLLGVPLAVVARAGSRPKRSIRSLVRPILCLLAIMAACALGAGILGRLFAESGAVTLVGRVARGVPADRHVHFIADLWAHSARYFVGNGRRYRGDRAGVAVARSPTRVTWPPTILRRQRHRAGDVLGPEGRQVEARRADGTIASLPPASRAFSLLLGHRLTQASRNRPGPHDTGPPGLIQG